MIMLMSKLTQYEIIICLQPSGHYMYRTAVTICTAQLSLYLPHSDHYMYRTVVTICTAQRSLYVPPSLTFNNSTFCPHSVFMCFVWISEQTAIISLYSINWLVFATETQCVYCAVRTDYLCIIHASLSPYRLRSLLWQTDGSGDSACYKLKTKVLWNMKPCSLMDSVVS